MPSGVGGPYRELVDSNPEILPVITDPPWYVRWWHKLTGHAWADIHYSMVTGLRCDICGKFQVSYREDTCSLLCGYYSDGCTYPGDPPCAACKEESLTMMEFNAVKRRFELMPRWK